MKVLSIVYSLVLATVARGFVVTIQPNSKSHRGSTVSLSSSTLATVDPKEAVKLFGRLAEKYIMLDASAGQCCYSGCKDCEYRLPGGGYRMADQSSARPKWIPSYSLREANGKSHATKWSLELFGEGTYELSKDEFIERLVGLEYAPPLGGPYIAASSATIEDTGAARFLFVSLAGNEDAILTKENFSTRVKDLASGEEGLTWAGFQAALGL